MNSSIERLLSLRVKDCMSKETVTLRDDMSIVEAAERLHATAITGAPVVDADGSCVGVISLSDLTVDKATPTREFELASTASSGDEASQQSASSSDRQCANECVCDRMSLLIHMVDAETPLMNAARMMCLEHVHRLVVLNELEEPIGVISSLDVVAATVIAVEE